MGVRRLAVVDDDVQYLQGVRRIARQLDRDLEIIALSGGPEALAYFARDTADFLVMDVRMPDVNGIEVCKVIKASHRTHVVLASGHMSQETREEVIAAGADMAVSKPYEVGKLLGELLGLAEGSQPEIQLISSDHYKMARNIARGLARRYHGLISAEDAEGLAMIGLCESARRYDPSRNGLFIAFASARIRGAILDEVRTQSARTFVASGIDEADEPTCTEPTPIFAVERAQEYASVTEARRELAPLEAEVIRLHYDEDISLAAVARQLRLSEGKVLSLHHQVLARMRRRNA